MIIEQVRSDQERYSFDQVKDYLQRPGIVNWLPASELLAGLHDACVDGRTEHPVIANPGGDMAILMQAVISVGNEMGKQFSEVELMRIFDWYLGNFGNFYM